MIRGSEGLREIKGRMGKKGVDGRGSKNGRRVERCAT